MTICGTISVERMTCSYESELTRGLDCEIGTHDGDARMGLDISLGSPIFEREELHPPWLHLRVRYPGISELHLRNKLHSTTLAACKSSALRQGGLRRHLNHSPLSTPHCGRFATILISLLCGTIRLRNHQQKLQAQAWRLPFLVLLHSSCLPRSFRSSFLQNRPKRVVSRLRLFLSLTELITNKWTGSSSSMSTSTSMTTPLPGKSWRKIYSKPSPSTASSQFPTMAFPMSSMNLK